MTLPSVPRSIAALAAALVLAWPASGPAAAQGRRPGPDPNLRALSFYVDSTALVEALRAVPPPPPESVPSDFFVTFNPEGSAVVVEPAFEGLPAEYAAEMTRLLRAHVRTLSLPLAPCGMNIRLHGGPSPTVAYATYRRQTPPRLTNVSVVQRQLARSLESLNPPLPPRRGPLVGLVSIALARDGGITEVYLLEGTGRLDLDVETVRIAKMMRFAPARIDGRAVPTMATMPVSFSYAEPEPFPAAEPPSD